MPIAQVIPSDSDSASGQVRKIQFANMPIAQVIPSDSYSA